MLSQKTAKRYNILIGEDFPQQRLAEHILGRSDLGRVARGARADRTGTSGGDGLESALLVRRVALHGLNQVGDQVMSTLEFDINPRPGFLGPVPSSHQSVS